MNKFKVGQEATVITVEPPYIKKGDVVTIYASDDDPNLKVQVQGDDKYRDGMWMIHESKLKLKKETEMNTQPKLKPGMIVECYSQKHLYINNESLLALNGAQHTTLTPTAVTKIWDVIPTKTAWNVLTAHCNDNNLIYARDKPKTTTEDEPKMENVKVGDWIFTITEGWTKVTGVNPCARSGAIQTQCASFSVKGNYNPGDRHPSAWTYDPFSDTQPPEDFKAGEVIAVQDDGDQEWDYEVFGGHLARGVKDIDGCIWNYARKLTAEEKGE